MSIVNGVPANATNFNASFLSRTTNSSTTGVIALNNSSDAASGSNVANAQGGLNNLFDAVGMTAWDDATRKTYATTNYLVNGSDHKANLSNLDVALNTLEGEYDAHAAASTGVHGVSGSVVGTNNTQTLTAKSFAQNLKPSTTENYDVGESALKWRDLYLSRDADIGGDVTIGGNLQVNGTQTIFNTETVDVEDANITINKNGAQLTADGISGITVEMSDATDVTFIYDSTLASRWKAGDAASEIELANVSSAQSFTNKSIDADSNTITNIDNNEIKAAAGILVNKLEALAIDRALQTDGSGFIEASSVTNIELSYVGGVTSAIQTQLDGKEPTLSKGNLTETTSSVLTITGGTGAVIGAGTTIEVDNGGANWNANELQGRTVHTTAPTDGQALVWNSGDSRWEPGSAAASAPALTDTYIGYGNASNQMTGESDFTWDATGNQMTIGGANGAQTGNGINLYDGTNDPVIWMGNATTGSGASNGAFIQMDGSQLELINQSGNIQFKAGSGLGAYLNTSSDFGIGKASPSVRLHVEDFGSGSAPTFVAHTVAAFQGNVNTTQDCAVALISGTAASAILNFGDDDDDNIGGIEYDNAANGMNIYVNGALRQGINSSGTTTFTGPDNHVLDIQSTSRSTIRFNPGSSSGTHRGGLAFYDNASAFMWSMETDRLNTGANSDLYFYNAGLGGYHLYLEDSTGFTGINKSSPNCELDVNGSIAGASTNTTGTNPDVSGITTLVMNTSTGNVGLQGLQNGVTGQMLHILKGNSANTLTINHNGTGTQKIFTKSSSNIVLGAGYGGVTVVFTGTVWFALNS